MMRSQKDKIGLQRGATLIVSLVILAVITILGLASMRSSNLELRMAASARDRAVAFQRAEAALLRIERNLAQKPFPPLSFDTNCTGDRCFTKDCTGGLCFSGEFDSLGTRDQCQLADPTQVKQQSWKDPEVWSDSTKHQTLENIPTTAEGRTGAPVRFIIEFMCFVPGNDREMFGGAGGSVQQDDDALPIYRITVQAPGEAGRSNVILQSVFRSAI